MGRKSQAVKFFVLVPLVSRVIHEGLETHRRGRQSKKRPGTDGKICLLESIGGWQGGKQGNARHRRRSQGK